MFFNVFPLTWSCSRRWWTLKWALKEEIPPRRRVGPTLAGRLKFHDSQRTCSFCLLHFVNHFIFHALLLHFIFSPRYTFQSQSQDCLKKVKIVLSQTGIICFFVSPLGCYAYPPWKPFLLSFNHRDVLFGVLEQILSQTRLVTSASPLIKYL